MIRVTGLVLIQLALYASMLFSQETPKPADAVAPVPAAAPAQSAPAAQPAAKEEPKPAVQPAPEVKPVPTPIKEAVTPKPSAPTPTPVAAKNIPAPAKKDAPAPVSAPAAPVKNVLDNAPLSLIEINEGDFRYKRIQGFVAEKKQVAEAKSTENKTSSVSNALSEKKQMIKGLTGWFVIISIIVIVFVLYRYSRKKRRRKVFRRIR